jgi:hypothetical protein
VPNLLDNNAIGFAFRPPIYFQIAIAEYRPPTSDRL